MVSPFLAAFESATIEYRGSPVVLQMTLISPSSVEAANILCSGLNLVAKICWFEILKSMFLLT